MTKLGSQVASNRQGIVFRGSPRLSTRSGPITALSESSSDIPVKYQAKEPWTELAHLQTLALSSHNDSSLHDQELDRVM
jgi:hypothetical protein